MRSHLCKLMYLEAMGSELQGRRVKSLYRKKLKLREPRSQKREASQHLPTFSLFHEHEKSQGAV